MSRRFVPNFRKEPAYIIFLGLAIFLFNSCNTATEDIKLSEVSISGFQPAKGAVGATIQVIGTGFSSIPSNNEVYFSSGDNNTVIRAFVQKAETNSLTVTVPSGATTGPVSVKVLKTTATSAVPSKLKTSGASFVVEDNIDPDDPSNVVIDDFAPTSYNIDLISTGFATVLITGSGFSSTPSGNVVTFGTIPATINPTVPASSEVIAVYVPSSLPVGNHDLQVTVNGKTYNTVTFTVEP